MNKRFHIGKGRYETLVNSRFKSYTYGRNAIKADIQDPDDVQTHGTYGALLFDKRWIQRRAEILQRDGHRCVICRSEQSLQVHHRQYHFIKALEQFISPWDYDDPLLITLCDKCHSRGHSKFKVPSVVI